MNVHQEWMIDDSTSDDDIGIGYFFSRNYGSAASVTLYHDGTLVFDGYHRKMVIKNIGTEREQVVIENAADLVL
ncbi:MAG: hypothetical protein EBW40_07955 [Gammaproteobacteria bacterium]|nr:hypothetical protein [Gammaproteobacteria bacterium]